MAGVGKPLKDNWFESLTLNFASLTAEHTIIKNEKYFRLGVDEFVSIHKKITKVGRIPNETKSESESSCFPKAEVEFNFLAMNPSIKSNNKQP